MFFFVSLQHSFSFINTIFTTMKSNKRRKRNPILLVPLRLAHLSAEYWYECIFLYMRLEDRAKVLMCNHILAKLFPYLHAKSAQLSKIFANAGSTPVVELGTCIGFNCC